MTQLKDKKTIENAKKTFEKVFKNKDPFSNCFQKNIESRILLFPTEVLRLTEFQLNILMETIRIYDKEDIYISHIELKEYPNYINEHWVISSDITYEEYDNMPFIFENAIYSQTGKWGVIISHEEHALVGGKKDFIKKYLSIYKNSTKDVNEFKKYYDEAKKEYPRLNIDWVDELLEIIDN